VSQRPDERVIKSLQSPSEQLLSSNHVISEILCRWHAMKVLFDIYCNSSIRAAYLETCLIRPERSTFGDDEDEGGFPSSDDPPAPPSDGFCDGFKQLSFKAKNRAYQRFYQALTAHWVAVEFAWLSKIRIYRDAQDRERFFNKVRDMWTDNDSRTLQEKLDIIEIVDFVWVFLVRKIFYSPSCLLDWFDSPFEGRGSPDGIPSLGQSSLAMWLAPFLEDDGIDEIPNSLCNPMFVHRYSEFFIKDATEYLRPTHIIELLLLLTWSPEKPWKVDRFEYLRKLGFVDTIARRLQEHNWQFENRFTIDLPENDVLSDLASWGFVVIDEELDEEILRQEAIPFFEEPPFDEDDIYDICKTQWPRYRRGKKWVSEMRGLIFFREETPKELFKRIINLKLEDVFSLDCHLENLEREQRAYWGLDSDEDSGSSNG
jgi:hypothetical protein